MVNVVILTPESLIVSIVIVAGVILINPREDSEYVRF